MVRAYSFFCGSVFVSGIHRENDWEKRRKQSARFITRRLAAFHTTIRYDTPLQNYYKLGDDASTVRTQSGLQLEMNNF